MSKQTPEEAAEEHARCDVTGIIDGAREQSFLAGDANGFKRGREEALREVMEVAQKWNVTPPGEPLGLFGLIKKLCSAGG